MSTPDNPLKWKDAFRAFLYGEYESLEQYAKITNLKDAQLRELRASAEYLSRQGDSLAQRLLETEKQRIAEAGRKALVEVGKNKVRQEVIKSGGKELIKTGGKSYLPALVRFGGMGLRIVLGVTTAISILMLLWGLYSIFTSSTKPSVSVSGEGPCPTPVLERRKCPWSPDGYAVEPCGPGFCFDSGPQGALACKQEQGVPNAYRNYTSDLNCADGYAPERDRCTGVIVQCVKQ